MEIILSELSIVNPSTYISVNKDCSTLIAGHVVDLAKWNIAVASKMKPLPTLYWLPKLHKSPYGSRFIAASNICTTKPLSRLLTSCLSLEYCEGKILELIVSGLSITHNRWSTLCKTLTLPQQLNIWIVLTFQHYIQVYRMPL